MAAPQPYLMATRDAGGEELHPLPPREKSFDEDWLQDLLFKHPSILPVGLVDDSFAPLIPIGREIGGIDNLFISPEGLLTIVETKLWRNPQAHRVVVAQILNYAKRLTSWTYQKLEKAVQEYMQQNGRGSRTLFEIAKSHSPEGLSEVEFRRGVQAGIESGRFALLVVGDQIYPEATELAELIKDSPHLHFLMGFVELHCYRLKKNSGWPLIVFPSLVAKTKETPRATVTIVYEEKKPQVEVEVPLAPDAPPLSGDRFFEVLRKNKGIEVENLARKVYRWAQRRSDDIWWGSGKVQGQFAPVLEHKQEKHSLFGVWIVDGCVHIYFGAISKMPPFHSRKKREQLLHRINTFLREKFSKEDALKGYRYPGFPLSALKNPDAWRKFQQTFDWYAREVKST
jgi:hypothetical protein